VSHGALSHTGAFFYLSKTSARLLLYVGCMTMYVFWYLYMIYMVYASLLTLPFAFAFASVSVSVSITESILYLCLYVFCIFLRIRESVRCTYIYRLMQVSTIPWKVSWIRITIHVRICTCTFMHVYTCTHICVYAYKGHKNIHTHLRTKSFLESSGCRTLPQETSAYRPRLTS